MLKIEIGKAYVFPDGEAIKIVAGIHTLRFGYTMLAESSRYDELMPINHIVSAPLEEISERDWHRAWQQEFLIRQSNGKSIDSNL